MCNYGDDLLADMEKLSETLVASMNLMLKELNKTCGEKCGDMSESIATIAINMAKLSELKESDMTGEIDSWLTKDSPLLDFDSPAESDISVLEKLVQAASNIISIKLSNYQETNNSETNIELQANLSEKVVSMTEFIEEVLAIASNALPAGKNMSFSNEQIAVSVCNDDTALSGPRTYSISSQGAAVEVPFDVLAEMTKKGSIRTKIVEWKVNPYENFTALGKSVNSTVIGFSFIDEESNEIKIDLPKPVSIKIPLLTKERKKLKFDCVYFDPTFVKYLSSSFTMLV
eukprot:TRINITY_DN13960_c0_g1_i1.p1 TRINITY_DN13960_c0_g1~~TRINITY_DN13960_c0_g1_i1.p1  ORF type:complete len:287 (+),score=86.41 TRINITY_DN13960_c0_g1_i1:203-1063(+)